jgi:lipopolysaccharide transport system permease protein
MSFGLIVSALTTKYRDLVHLVGFGVQLLMYATPVVYPLSIITDERTRTLITLNPMTSVLETFRHSFLGSGSVSYSMLGYSFGISVVLFALAVVLFSRVEKTFMDTV